MGSPVAEDGSNAYAQAGLVACFMRLSWQVEPNEGRSVF